MDKVATAAEAVADVADGASLAVGGFGLCGIPEALTETAPGVSVDEVVAKTDAPINLSVAS